MIARDDGDDGAEIVVLDEGVFDTPLHLRFYDDHIVDRRGRFTNRPYICI